MQSTNQVRWGKPLEKTEFPSLEAMAGHLLEHLARHPLVSLSVRDLGRVLARDYGLLVLPQTMDKTARKVMDHLYDRDLVNRIEIHQPQFRIRWQIKGGAQ